MSRRVALGLAVLGCAATPTEIVVQGGSAPAHERAVVLSPTPSPTTAPADAPVEPDAALDVAIEGSASFVAFRSDDVLLVATDTLGTAGGVAEIDATNGEALRVIAPAPAGPPAAFSATTKTIAYTTEDGVTLQSLDGDARPLVLPRPGSLAFSPAGDRLLVTTAEPVERATAIAIDTTTGKKVKTWQPFGRRVLPYDSGFLLVARFMPDDRVAFLLANDTPSEAHVAVWTANGRRKRFGVELVAPPTDDDEVFGMAPRLGEALAILPDGRIVAGNLDAHVFAVTDAGVATAHASTTDSVTALAVAPDGTWLAVAGERGPLVLLGLPGFEPIATASAPEHCGTLAVSPDGRRLAAGGDEVVRIWSIDGLRRDGGA